MNLKPEELKDILTILNRRANEIAGYSEENRKTMPSSVEYTLELEIKRLRSLAHRLSTDDYELKY